MTRAQLAVASGLSTGYITKLEQGHADNPSAEVVHRLCEALEISGAQRVHLFALARQVPTPTGSAGVVVDPDATRRSITAEQIEMLERLNPHTCSYVDQYWNVLYANSECRRLYRGLTEAGSTLTWMFLSSEAREVMVDWDFEAATMVAWMRAMYARRPDDAVFRALLEQCAVNPDFVTYWDSQDVVVARKAPHLRLRDLDTGEIHEIIAQLWPSPDPTQPISFYLGIRTGVGAPSL